MHPCLAHIQHVCATHADPRGDPTRQARIAILPVNNLIYVDFFGSPFDQPFLELCTCLAHPDIASVLAAVVFRAPDSGTNGTCNWDISALVQHAPAFPQLQTFIVEQNGPSDHNRRIIARAYAENGVLGQLLHKAPRLQTLIVPSAPDSTFFAKRHAHLRLLSVDSGYDTQHFIRHLAEHDCFPALYTFAFGEFNETYMEDFPDGCTPFSDYRNLFLAAHFATVRSFVWRNPVCSPEEIAELRALRPAATLHIKIISFSAQYISDRE